MLAVPAAHQQAILCHSRLRTVDLQGSAFISSAVSIRATHTSGKQQHISPHAAGEGRHPTLQSNMLADPTAGGTLQSSPHTTAQLTYKDSCNTSPVLRKGQVVACEAQLATGSLPLSILQAAQQLFPQLYTSVTAVKRACRRRELLLTGRPAVAADVVLPGQTLQVVQRQGSGPTVSNAQPRGNARPDHLSPHPEGQQLRVLYEDDHLACVVKPQGMPTQGSGTNTAQGAAKLVLQPSNALGALYRPQHCHRLDAPTGGLLLFAKTRQALRTLCDDLMQHRVSKRYAALAKGRVEAQEGTIDMPLGGQQAVTDYKVVAHYTSKAYGCLTRIDLWPRTGRTHQLRKHMAYTGTPLLGDDRYRGPRAGGAAHAEDPTEEDAMAVAYGDNADTTKADFLHTVTCSVQTDVSPATAGHTGAISKHSVSNNKVMVLASDSHALQTEVHNADGMPFQVIQTDTELHAETINGSSDSHTVTVSGDHRTCGNKVSRMLGAHEQIQAEPPPHSDADSGSQAGKTCEDVLCNGTAVPHLCLWAVELQLSHPVTGQALCFQLPEQDELFKQIIEIETDVA